MSLDHLKKYEGLQMTDLQKEVVYLKEEMGMTRQQIAKSKGMSVSAVKGALERGRKKIRFAESKGAQDIASQLGISMADVNHAWIKGENGSFFIKDQQYDKLTEEDIIDTIKDVFTNELKPVAPIRLDNEFSKQDDSLMTKYVLADLHLGMFAWAEESGEDYDLKIAEDTLKDSLVALMQSTPASETALILNLGDYFHANDNKGITPLSGHILDMDSRFPKIASVGIRAIRFCIESLARKHKKVIYAGIPGNHDPDQTHWLTIALMEAYRDNPNIEIVWNGSPWYVHQHGKNMIAAHHGDRTNFQRLVMAMADNYSDVWGGTTWRFLDTGHVHHQKEHEIGGVLCRSYRTLAAKDAYSSKGAYTSKRSLTAHTYHKNRGEILTNNVNLFNGTPAK